MSRHPPDTRQSNLTLTMKKQIDSPRDGHNAEEMTGTYKVIGLDPGDIEFRLGNCLTLRRSPELVNAPGMYAKIRHSAMGWMNSPGSMHNYLFFERLFASGVVLDRADPESKQAADSMEDAVLVAALLMAFPDARFGIGLLGGEGFLSGGHYRSLGTSSVALQDGTESRAFLTRLFDYLLSNSYWVDDDLVHILALLSALCQDRDRITPVQVLSLSTSGNHQVDAGLFHAWQLVEALLEIREGEPVRDAVARWNGTHSFQLDPDQIDLIRNLRDLSLHFKAPRAEKRLRESVVALGFDRDRSRQHEFRRHGIQRLLRAAALAYFRARL